MKEWTLYDRHPDRLLRFRIGRGYGWKRNLGLGVSYERLNYGTTYREPGTNEGSALHVHVGPYHFELLYTWKDMTQNRVDDPESYIHAQTRRN